VYVEGERQQVVYGIANRLQPAGIPDRWKRPRVVHIAPVFDECNSIFRYSFHRNAFVGVTLQGWFRQFHPDGRVLTYLREDGLEFLHRVSAVVISEEDIQGDWAYANHIADNTNILVVTRGSDGGFIYQNGEKVHFDTPAITEVNPTGAGDIFAAIFFGNLVRQYTPMTACHIAACCAAQSVTRDGLMSIPTQQEIHKCSLNCNKA
jgi:sugar/nucleoside kinase (ribokinase family)